MNLLLIATLAAAAAVSVDGAGVGVRGGSSVPHALVGAEQLPWLEAHCEGCQPDYCYPSKGAREDFNCYKSGLPKCCEKSKGNCPNNKPGCECEGDCKNNSNGNDNRTDGERCTRDDGTCRGDNYCDVNSCGGQGRCEVMPTGCNKNIAKVCGCNGQTYNNECLANAVGVSVDYTGSCDNDNDNDRDGDRCNLFDDDCRSDEYCQVDEGRCSRSSNAEGRCTPLRNTCPYSYRPVCGCDGETYDNAECAASEGINVDYDGECD